MKRHLLTLLALFLVLCGYTQSTITIRFIEAGSKKKIAQIPFTLSLDNQKINSFATDANGFISIADLIPGNYTITTLESSDYFDKTEKFRLKINEKKELEINIVARKNINLNEVAVVADKKRNTDKIIEMNKLDATVSSVITQKEIGALPIEGRDVTKSFYRLPNLTLATLGYAESPNVAMNGLNGIYTNYMIDGMDNNERFLGNVKFNTPFGFTEKVTVLTNNYSAEYGNTSAGIVNLTTKSGGNELSAEAFYLTRPGRYTDAASKFATLDLSGNPVKDGFQRHQAGFGLGGAIVKDKTFFYVNFEQTNDIKDNLLTVPELGVNEIVRGRNNFSYASAKIDQYWSTKFHTSLRANYGVFDIDRQGGGLEGGVLFPSAAAAQKNRTYLVALKNDYQLGEKLMAETNFQTSYFRWNYREPDNPGKPSVNVQAPNGRLIANIGYNGALFDDAEYTNQVQQKFSYKAGKHQLKAGAEFTTSSFSLLGGGNPFGAYTVRLNQAQLDDLKARNVGAALDVNDIPSAVQVINYQVELAQSTFDARQNVFNVYAEDNFSFNERLNLSAGVRYDYDNLSKGGGNKGDYNNIAPRLSANYKLNSKSVIKAGYGVYYDKIKYSVYSDNLQFSNDGADFKRQLQELQRLGLLSADADIDKITHPGNILSTPAGATTYLNGKTAAEVQGNRDTQFSNNYRIQNPNGYSNPYSQQFTVGYQRQIDENKIFFADVIHSRTNNLFVITNLNSPSAYPINDPNADSTDVRTVAAANASRPIPIITGNRAVIGGDTLRGIARDIFMTETIGRSVYTALNLVFQKSRDENSNFSYRLSYSLSQVKNTGESINTRAQDANDFDAEYAIGDNDRTHVMSAVLTWYPLKNLSITPALLFQSGQPITRVANATTFKTTDLNGNGESFGLTADRQPGVVRNSDRLPSSTTFDMSIKYDIKIKGNSRFELSADVYNLFNTQNFSGYNVTRGASNQTQVGPANQNNLSIRSAAPPRQFQFGIRYLLGS